MTTTKTMANSKIQTVIKDGKLFYICSECKRPKKLLRDTLCVSCDDKYVQLNTQPEKAGSTNTQH